MATEIFAGDESSLLIVKLHYYTFRHRLYIVKKVSDFPVSFFAVYHTFLGGQFKSFYCHFALVDYL